MYLKRIATAALMVIAMAGCNSKNSDYNELVKNGIVHEAQIYEIDSLKNVCKYRLVVNEEEYYGHCNQRPDDQTQLKVNQYILVVYLARDPSINRRLADSN